MKDKSEISDGFHTFRELYEQRHAIFAALCIAHKEKAWRARYHAEGDKMDGWFVAGIDLPTGQVSFHMPDKYWDNFKLCQTIPKSKWDGYTTNDVVDRINDFTSIVNSAFSSPDDE